MVNGMPSYNQPFAGNTPQYQAQAQQSAFTNPQMNQQQYQQQQQQQLQQQQQQQQQPHQQQQPYGNNQFMFNQGNQLICRNALGQDLTLTKDSCKSHSHL